MLIQFTVGNCFSFNDKRTFSFEARGVSELKENVFTVNKYKLLKSAVLYGANSSGKSNFINSLLYMKNIIKESIKLNSGDSILYSPFLLAEHDDLPTYFEMVFLIDNVKYRYGFEYTENEIIKEWLFFRKGAGKDNYYFVREEGTFSINTIFKEGKDKDRQTNKNRLFLSLVAQLGGKISNTIMNWFDSYKVISGINEKAYAWFSMDRIRRNKKSNETNDIALEFLKKLKLGFEDIDISEIEVNEELLAKDLPDKAKEELLIQLKGKFIPYSKHIKYSKNGDQIGEVSFNFEEYESEGTKKIFKLSGPIFESLAKGSLLVIDELDAKMHPLLTIEIIKLFNSTKTNPNNAQLLFATHDTNLLSTSLFRRDQIWFAEKDEKEQTDLYSLINFKIPNSATVRNDLNYRKNYINGRFGGIPYIHDVEFDHE